ncbi:MAG: hypothetical protein A2Y88_02965 [Chloroflexi bacterium RBG_13_48_10]|nr:MAG: hypothetical protein A2Y88_02965 [Chloroflexi bacterium RBG_13_48_10]
MKQDADQTNDLIYSERISSDKTEALFPALMLLFLLLLIWRVVTGRLYMLVVVFSIVFTLFLFYSINYRILNIRLTPASLRLKFGIFTWTVPVDNIEECDLDDLPLLMRFGGAGIHFMTIRKRYLASFNFLEYPRVVIGFKRKVGLVRDISFSTRQPDEVIRHIHGAVAATGINQYHHPSNSRSTSLHKRG